VAKDAQASGPAASEAPTPHPGLKVLERLVGTWKVSGEVEGETSYEWMDGGFFLIARGVLDQGGTVTRHMEIIGYDHPPEAGEPARVLTSRLYTSGGNTLSYTHEVDDKTVKSWYGPKGSPAFFEAEWSPDGDSLTGAWQWPGGGYKLTMTRLKGRGGDTR
jgi:hypothetical protein